MEQMPKKNEREDVERPPCSSCGEPATCEVVLTVQSLVLEREAGMKSQPQWVPSWHPMRTKVQHLSCDACVKANVVSSVVVRAVMTEEAGS